MVNPLRDRKSGAGNPPPTAARAAFLPDGDGVQRPLRSRFPPRLMPSVRPLILHSWTERPLTQICQAGYYP
jgi:hypothetical protein